MKLIEIIECMDKDDEIVVCDKDYDVEVYFNNDPETNWGKYMLEIASILDVTDVLTNGYEVNLSDVIGSRIENIKESELFIDASVDSIMEDIVFIFTGDVSDIWMYKFVMALTENYKNTMNSFEKDGFKIVRNGMVITLTQEEMSEFRYLDTALNGRNSIEVAALDDDSFDQDIIKEMMDNEEICYQLENDILDNAFSDIGNIEYEYINDYYKKTKGE